MKNDTSNENQISIDKILDGKAMAKQVRKEVKKQAAEFAKIAGRTPRLDVILVGDDPASQVYVKNKKRGCKRAGLESREHLLFADTTQETLLELVLELNNDNQVDGILIQLPLPNHIDTQKVLGAIDPLKDVDGFHAVNLGNLLIGTPKLVPCTPAGCMRMLKETGVELSGKEAVVIGRSTIVGKPMAHLLLAENATVTMCHSRTKNLNEVVKRADIVVAAVGRPHMIKGDWIKPGAVVLDVGINRLDDGQLVGDVEFETAKMNASFITPVPGGVGPMTIAYLLQNTLVAAENRAIVK